MNEDKTASASCPVSMSKLRQQLHDQVDRLADFCENCDDQFFAFEKKLKEFVWAVGRLLIALFLLARHQRLEKQDRQHPGYRRLPNELARKLRTMFGEVRYQRAYWVKRGGSGGFHPLDAELGLTRDGFSPWVMSLACRLTA